MGRSPIGGLPAGAIFKAMMPNMIDTIGLSISDYLLVPAAHRSIYFVDETTMRTAEQILINIAASAFLNDGGEMVGNATRGYTQYQDGTSKSILRKAYRYFGETYPDTTYWQRVDNSNILRTDGSPIEVF